MRGKAKAMLGDYDAIRITPAYAGKSLTEMGMIHFDWDHPRLCGEKIPSVPTVSLPRGSPPPMRGKVQRCQESDRYTGITPAYAGKSRNGVFVRIAL